MKALNDAECNIMRMKYLGLMMGQPAMVSMAREYDERLRLQRKRERRLKSFRFTLKSLGFALDWEPAEA